MWHLPHSVKKTGADPLNSRICAQDGPGLPATSVRNQLLRSRKLLQSYPKVINHFLMKYASNREIDENDAEIPRYVQQASMTSQ